MIEEPENHLHRSMQLALSHRIFVDEKYKYSSIEKPPVPIVFRFNKYYQNRRLVIRRRLFTAYDTLEGKTLNITYLSCQEDTSDNMFITPKDGCTYVTCEFEFENVSDSDVSLSFYSFDCFADGISCEQAFFRDDGISATLSPGRKAKGTVTFEVPKDAEVVEVEYLTNFWTSNRVVFNASNY